MKHSQKGGEINMDYQMEDFNFQREHNPMMFRISVHTQEGLFGFQNIKQAQEKFQLDPIKSTKDFTSGMFGGWVQDFDTEDEYPIMRFEDWETYNNASR